jgi:glutamate transport system permease protein
MSVVLFDVPGPRARRRARIGSAIGVALLLALAGAVVWKLHQKGIFAKDQWDVFTDSGILKGLARGLGATLRAALFAVLLALLLGVILAAGRLSRRVWLRWPTGAFVEFFRAIPLVLLILFLFLGFGARFNSLGERLQGGLPDRVSAILGITELGSLAPLILALGLYNGAVLAEVFRAGILAVPRGQREAAYAIGLTDRDVMRAVLLPQAVRIMLPAIISQSVVALKDTSLGFIISYPELVRVGRGIYDQHFNILPTAFVVTAIYVTLNMTLSALAERVNQRQSRRYSRDAVAVAASAVDSR